MGWYDGQQHGDVAERGITVLYANRYSLNVLATDAQSQGMHVFYISEVHSGIVNE